MKSPAFQFYAAEFLVDENVVLMSNAEVGCYVKLMAYDWREGSIPDSAEKCARLCGESVETFAGMWSNIRECFNKVRGQRLSHPRLQKEREKQSQYAQMQSAKGKASAAKRAQSEHSPRNHGLTAVQSRLHSGSTEPQPELYVPVQPKGHSSSSSSPSGTSPTHRGGEDIDSEVPTEAQAVAQAELAGVPSDFARHVYEDWSTRQGRDAGGVLVSYPHYVKKRWNREGAQWKSGTHNAKKGANAGNSKSSGESNRGALNPGRATASQYRD